MATLQASRGTLAALASLHPANVFTMQRRSFKEVKPRSGTAEMARSGQCGLRLAERSMRTTVNLTNYSCFGNSLRLE
ncbi:hypothetical protein RvY_01112 [Ramazzottius varieornatus]|uniref:Uncharacterized protein n=1 Tax=Ramazzottius varieornatus TaxID=947166 RepID=A0A1D1UF55_RAMVA|nr:hypothetical protein RvY_01112 [Ramazzottius varieornatus]